MLLSACGDKLQPSPPEELGPGQLDIQAAQAASPPGMPGDFDGDDKDGDFQQRLRLFDVDDDGLPELVCPTVQGIAVLKLARR